MKTTTKVMAATFAVGLIGLSAGHEADAAEVKEEKVSVASLDQQAESQSEKIDDADQQTEAQGGKRTDAGQQSEKAAGKNQLLLDASATYSSQLIEEKKTSKDEEASSLAKEGADSEIKEESAKAEDKSEAKSEAKATGESTGTEEGQSSSAQAAEDKVGQKRFERWANVLYASASSLSSRA